ncbi:MAG: hypothetical protein LUH10_02895 [Tannerellaceae bacterium]|nr:hypothetical protein [Tannerellaceae bacterium]
MKKNLFVYLLSGLFLCVGLISCDKDDSLDDDVVSSPRSFYVLTRGNWGKNNAALGYYDAKSKEYTADYFEKQNNDKLGDSAEDVLIHGSKMYITVYNSNSIIVTDLNAKLLKVIDPGKSEPMGPRRLIANGRNIFVTYQMGHTVAVLDTTTLSITGDIPVGRYPEQMAISGNKLFVTNSGGLDYNNDYGYGKTISVIDLSSFEEEEKIEVMINPTKIIANNQGDLFVISMGDYSEDKPNTLQRITKEGGKYKVESIGKATVMNLVENTLYTIYSQAFWDMETNQSTTIIEYVKYDATTGKAQGNYLNNPDISNPYSLDIDPISGYFYINDYVYETTNDLFVFDANGNKKGRLETEGFDVTKVLFYP